MSSRRFKSACFVLEGLNSFAAVYYFYYFFFFMQKEYGFGNKANLALAALSGAVCTLASWLGGRFAQRFGYLRALKLGFGTMACALAAGSQLHSVLAQIGVMCLVATGVSFTWPALEALVSEGEPPQALPRTVGLYNVVWATAAALANFSGGAMLELWGLKSLFYVPLVLVLSQWLLTLYLAAQGRGLAPKPEPQPEPQAPGPQKSASALSGGAFVARARSFMRMAWLANPFAYIAINTLVAVIPGIAQRLQLSTMMAGFCCSLWCFSRLGAFVLLWAWDGWHYRFRWMLAAYGALVASFAILLLVPNLMVLLAAQLVFGAGAGLLYYSSLYYSMDSSESKGEHGGIHEAAIGLGNAAGPAVGAAALQFLPAWPQSGALAVSLLLLVGLGGLMALWRKAPKPAPDQAKAEPVRDLAL